MEIPKSFERMLMARGFEDSVGKFSDDVGSPSVLFSGARPVLMVRPKKLSIEDVLKEMGRRSAHSAVAIVKKVGKLKYNDAIASRVQILTVDELDRLAIAMQSPLLQTHELVPKDEAESLCKKYGVDKMPLIMASDPVSKYFGFFPGDTVRVLRKKVFASGRTDVSVYYRKVSVS